MSDTHGPATDPSRAPGQSDATPLGLLTEQLWEPAITAGVARALVDPAPTEGWVAVERYRVLPRLSSARLLIPGASNRLAASALVNYRGLRRRAVNAQRALLGSALLAGAPVGRSQLVVQRLAAGGPELPLEMLARELGLPRVHASIGIRTGANRKATLQLIDDRGAPVGFAKFGWSPSSKDLVTTETSALSQVGGGSGALRAPALLVSGSWFEMPYLVCAPLPSTSRGLRADATPPTPQELASLCPVTRRDVPAATDQLLAIRRRLAEIAHLGVVAETVTRASQLVNDVALSQGEVSVAARWHGDLTPWNAARDGEGTLWCWDWESSETDAVAGLDSLHWFVSSRQERGQRTDGEALSAALDDAGEHLAAFGHGARGRAVVAAVYAASVTERACGMAARSASWDRLWIQPPQLHTLLETAASLLAAARP